ncbi:MAG TPA: TRIC cation channel family protein, partial [Pedococcus sp.]|nr:TRIC cation channel family protein [Pedococcus sp.]
MLTFDENLQLALDLVGIFAFALTGGLIAVKKRLDLFGVLVLAAAAALGGGVMRDLLIGDTPPVGISDWRLVSAAVLAGIVTFLFHPGVERI